MTSKAPQYSEEQVRSAIESHDSRWKVVRIGFKGRPDTGFWDLGIEMDYRDEYDIEVRNPKGDGRDGLIRFDAAFADEVPVEEWAGLVEKMAKQDLEENTIMGIGINGRGIYDGT